MLSRTIFAFLTMLNMVCCKESGSTSSSEQQDIGCQHHSTSGRDYKGTANTTRYGIPCQRWSDTQPHDHQFTHVGDHNFCRNPVGSYDEVWCYTTDPDMEKQYCSVPFCPSLQVLDFSLDSDMTPDEKGSYTFASLELHNFPASFSICTAFMVENWGILGAPNPPLFVLRDNNITWLDDKDQKWLYVGFAAAKNKTEFVLHLSGVEFTVATSSIFFPMQWTRLCLSYNGNTSLMNFVVDGDQLVERVIDVDTE